MGLNFNCVMENILHTGQCIRPNYSKAVENRAVTCHLIYAQSKHQW